MALPTNTELGSLDYTNKGIPFNNVDSNNTVNSYSMDYVFNGVSFIAAPGSAPITPVSTSTFFIVF